MKKILFFLFVLTLSSNCFGQKKDKRTFEQICDSIKTEAELILKYDNLFNYTKSEIKLNKKLNKKAGEILIYPKKDSLIAIVLNRKKDNNVIAQVSIKEFNESDTISLKTKDRVLLEEEAKFLEMKHKVFENVQRRFQIKTTKTEFINPVFIPFKTTRGSTTFQLYKLYLISETEAYATVPFGRDYLFYAKDNGEIFYNLQFNVFMPAQITEEVFDENTIKVKYPAKEHYLTATDLYLYQKYGLPAEIYFLEMYSEYLDLYFLYDANEDTLSVTQKK